MSPPARRERPPGGSRRASIDRRWYGLSGARASTAASRRQTAATAPPVLFESAGRKEALRDADDLAEELGVWLRRAAPERFGRAAEIRP